MNGRFLSLGLVAMSLALMVPAHGAPILVNGAATQQAVAKLTSEVSWTTSLSRAQSQAYHEGKLVFWVHMLGDMKGAT